MLSDQPLNQHSKYSFQQRLQLYKLAKKPRKQVRLKFDVIQKQSLPFLNTLKVADCKGLDSFVARIPKLKSYGGKNVQTTTAEEQKNENLMKVKNQLNQTKEANRRVRRLLEVNRVIRELGNVSLKKYNEVVNLSVGSDFFQ